MRLHEEKASAQTGSSSKWMSLLRSFFVRSETGIDDKAIQFFVESLEPRQMLNGLPGFDTGDYDHVPGAVRQSIDSIVLNSNNIASEMFFNNAPGNLDAESLAGSNLFQIEFLDDRALADFEIPDQPAGTFSIRMIDVDAIESFPGESNSPHSHVLFDQTITVTTSFDSQSGVEGYQIVTLFETKIVGLTITDEQAAAIDASQFYDLTGLSIDSQIDLSSNTDFSFIDHAPESGVQRDFSASTNYQVSVTGQWQNDSRQTNFDVAYTGLNYYSGTVQSSFIGQGKSSFSLTGFGTRLVDIYSLQPSYSDGEPTTSPPSNRNDGTYELSASGTASMGPVFFDGFGNSLNGTSRTHSLTIAGDINRNETDVRDIPFERSVTDGDTFVGVLSAQAIEKQSFDGNYSYTLSQTETDEFLSSISVVGFLRGTGEDSVEFNRSERSILFSPGETHTVTTVSDDFGIGTAAISDVDFSVNLTVDLPSQSSPGILTGQVSDGVQFNIRSWLTENRSVNVLGGYSGNFVDENGPSNPNELASASLTAGLLANQSDNSFSLSEFAGENTLLSQAVQESGLLNIPTEPTSSDDDVVGFFHFNSTNNVNLNSGAESPEDRNGSSIDVTTYRDDGSIERLVRFSQTDDIDNDINLKRTFNNKSISGDYESGNGAISTHNSSVARIHKSTGAENQLMALKAKYDPDAGELDNEFATVFVAGTAGNLNTQQDDVETKYKTTFKAKFTQGSKVPGADGTLPDYHHESIEEHLENNTKTTGTGGYAGGTLVFGGDDWAVQQKLDSGSINRTITGDSLIKTIHERDRASTIDIDSSIGMAHASTNGTIELPGTLTTKNYYKYESISPYETSGSTGKSWNSRYTTTLDSDADASTPLALNEAFELPAPDWGSSPDLDPDIALDPIEQSTFTKTDGDTVWTYAGGGKTTSTANLNVTSPDGTTLKHQVNDYSKITGNNGGYSEFQKDYQFGSTANGDGTSGPKTNSFYQRASNVGFGITAEGLVVQGKGNSTLKVDTSAFLTNESANITRSHFQSDADNYSTNTATIDPLKLSRDQKDSSEEKTTFSFRVVDDLASPSNGPIMVGDSTDDDELSSIDRLETQSSFTSIGHDEYKKAVKHVSTARSKSEHAHSRYDSELNVSVESKDTHDVFELDTGKQQDGTTTISSNLANRYTSFYKYHTDGNSERYSHRDILGIAPVDTNQITEDELTGDGGSAHLIETETASVDEPQITVIGSEVSKQNADHNGDVTVNSERLVFGGLTHVYDQSGTLTSRSGSLTSALAADGLADFEQTDESEYTRTETGKDTIHTKSGTKTVTHDEFDGLSRKILTFGLNEAGQATTNRNIYRLNLVNGFRTVTNLYPGSGPQIEQVTEPSGSAPSPPASTTTSYNLALVTEPGFYQGAQTPSTDTSGETGNTGDQQDGDQQEEDSQTIADADKWRLQAMKEIGITPAEYLAITWDDFWSNEASLVNGTYTPKVSFKRRMEILTRIYGAYAKLNLEDPERFVWPAQAAIAGEAINDALAFSTKALAELLKRRDSLNTGLLALFRSREPSIALDRQILKLLSGQRSLLEGNFAIWADIYWVFVAYKEAGIGEIEKLYKQGEISNLIYRGFKNIDKGNIELGNRQIFKHEQLNVLSGIFAQYPWAIDQSTGLFAWMLGQDVTAPAIDAGIYKNPIDSFVEHIKKNPKLGTTPDYGQFRQRWDYLTNVFDKSFVEAYFDASFRRKIRALLVEIRDRELED